MIPLAPDPDVRRFLCTGDDDCDPFEEVNSGIVKCPVCGARAVLAPTDCDCDEHHQDSSEK